MKLKFEKVVQDVINAVALLPDTATDKEDLNKPMNLIAAFERQLQSSKEMPTKQWSGLRRQLSFLFEMYFISNTAAKELASGKLGNSNIKAVEEETYRLLVSVIKEIHNNKALENVRIIRIGLKYGIIRLSDHEIQKLIDNNKID
jgi:hypothetical protein